MAYDAEFGVEQYVWDKLGSDFAYVAADSWNSQVFTSKGSLQDGSVDGPICDIRTST